jgi:uncharacterized protein (DUF1501 family)
MSKRHGDCRCSRRELLMGGVLAASGLGRALADPGVKETEFFVLIHASGGWDVTLWADPRNSRAGLVEPASTANTDTGGLRLWEDQPLDGDVHSFALVEPPGSRIVFGPGIGALAEHADRLCVVNGLAMNTVSHPDGIAYSVTGRHLSGARVSQPSLNTLLANEFGLGQTFPSVALQFPSYYAGEHLDPRAAPLSVDRVGSIARVLSRNARYLGADDAAGITALLSRETATLASRSAYGDVIQGMGLQVAGVARMLGDNMQDLFDEKKLRAAHPELDRKGRGQGAAVNAAFAVEAMRRNVVRCVSFAMGGLDTHAANYRQQALLQQDLFDLVAAMVRTLEKTPHPTRPGDKLIEHTHILVQSEFCRTPQLNLAGGRDHYPNNSALVISPRFRGNTVVGKTDPEQLLPLATRRFSDGERPISPPDLLATFLSAFGVPPRRYLREGEVVPEMLRG